MVACVQLEKIAQELSDLVIYLQPMGVKAFEYARQTGNENVSVPEISDIG